MAHLCVLIHFCIRIIRNNRWIKEVEETVGLDLLSDGSDTPFGFVLLLLLHLLHSEILAFLPVDCTPCTFKDLGSLQTQRCQLL